MDVVSEVLAARAADREDVRSMLVYSALAHLAIVVLIALAPAGWLGTAAEREPEVVMQVSLGGPVGPRDGGLATLGGRAIQQVQPVEAKPVVEPVRPPAAREPEMVEAKKMLPKKPTPPVAEAKDAKSRIPTKGAEVRPGTAVAETGGRGQGFGLTSGGGGTGGYLDVANFCCPDYLATMLDLVNRNWDSKQQADGTVLVRFAIQRDGRIADVAVERSSGTPALDYLAQRAMLLTRQLPPLPAAFGEPVLTVHLVFEYKR